MNIVYIGSRFFIMKRVEGVLRLFSLLGGLELPDRKDYCNLGYPRGEIFIFKNRITDFLLTFIKL
jgi:hypothetical protein